MSESFKKATEGGVGELASTEVKKPKIDAEFIKKREVIDIPVEGNFQGLLDEINQELGTKMLPRPEGTHVTILDIKETRVAEEKLTPRVLKALNLLNENLAKGRGISLQGVGYIDGSKEEGTGMLRDVDTKKGVAFINVDCPLAAVIRNELGLEEKQLRITLGYEGGDIRYHVVGQDEKGKKILKPVTRRLDYEEGSALDRKFGADLDKRLNVKFGEIGGPERKEKRKK